MHLHEAVAPFLTVGGGDLASLPEVLLVPVIYLGSVFRLSNAALVVREVSPARLYEGEELQ